MEETSGRAESQWRSGGPHRTSEEYPRQTKAPLWGSRSEGEWVARIAVAVGEFLLSAKKLEAR